MAIPKSSLKKRGNFFHLHYSERGARRRVSLHTKSLVVAKERQRQFDSARARGEESVFPTKTPLAQAVAAYIAHMNVSRTRHGCTADLSYLRIAFGPICDALIPARRGTRAMEEDADRRRREPAIEATYLEQISVAQVSDFIRERIQLSGIQAKTANRNREVLRRLFSWSMEEGGIRMPSDVNPAAKVKRYHERAPEIRFLTLEQIDQQLEILANDLVLRAMVATYIYAGLRREEALWLTIEDVDLHMGQHGTIAVRAKSVNGEFWEPKTKVNRVVPVSRSLRTHLDQFLETSKPEYWFFPSPRGKRWHPDNFSQKLRARNGEAGLTWSCLDFRHTFGSQLAMKGESLYKIATLMGNSPEVCRRHYAALLPESLIQCVEFDSEFPGAR